MSRIRARRYLVFCLLALCAVSGIVAPWRQLSFAGLLPYLGYAALGLVVGGLISALLDGVESQEWTTVSRCIAAVMMSWVITAILGSIGFLAFGENHIAGFVSLITAVIGCVAWFTGVRRPAVD